MLKKRVCDRKESEYERKKDGVLERKYDDGRSGDMGRRKNTEMKYVETLKSAALILCFALFINILFWNGQRMLLQRGIADEVLRFHVLANSDSEEDQAVKLEVRDAVLAWLEEAQGGRSATQGKKETANTGAENDSSFMGGLESGKKHKRKRGRIPPCPSDRSGGSRKQCPCIKRPALSGARRTYYLLFS